MHAKSSKQLQTHVMHCTILQHLYNLKHVKNTHGGMLRLIKVTLLNVAPFCFQVFCILQMIPNSPGRLICSLYHHIQTEKKSDTILRPLRDKLVGRRCSEKKLL